ncbi:MULTISPECIES: cbb3-type cytochrome c oxidase subunit 3 [Methylobacterium]|uniref:CcoQ/FixQ family Cbb3-type cytochrome c oxidase assembly chaperone n=1 Tax=Methylobacterium durans TaxID=2202825 RepID=A0A2U8W249_9HYPH|nr:cbb3-type cytochrome c oxidase subunit 3 [Methylobacterium durans]AWN39580.1 CcoQ/FixQ family Cbb3-type cytochrome c oxidase assembly chaperone [Methylobacterium durans]
MSYETAASFAQTSGLLYFVGIFAAVTLYAFWPRNRTRFEAAAHLPLNED